MPRKRKSVPAWPSRGGEMGARVRSFDWAGTSLGPIEQWPQSLKFAVDVILGSQVPMNVIWGPERVHFYNEAYQAFLGTKHPAAFGRPGGEHWGEIWEPPEAIHRRVFAGETVTLKDHPWTLIRNGRPEEAVFTGYFTPIRDAGEVVGSLCTCFETTTAVNARRERERFEQEHRESELRLQTAAELVGLGWSHWKPGSSVVDWDARTKALWGLSPNAPVDMQSAIAAIHPDDRHKVEAIRVAGADPTNRSYKSEYRVIGIEDGIERWIRAHGRIYQPEDPKSFIGAVLDITEEKQTEHALRDREARLQAAIDLVGISPYSGDPRTGALDWDARLKAMWGLPAEAYVDAPIAVAAIHPDDKARVASAWEASLDPAGDGVFIAQYRVVGIEDGVERWVSTHAKNYFEHGQAVRFIGAIYETTERKQAEERLHESEAGFRLLNETLEQQVWARTSALNAQIAERERLSDRLAILQTELFHASRVSTAGQMASQIAHELNQPLTAAANSLGAARRLLAHAFDTQVLGEVLDEARTEILRAGEIIHRVRGFMRGGLNTRRLEDIAALIEEAKALVLTPTLTPRDGIDFQIGPKAMTAFVDRIQIVQVLVNLFRNALEAMETSQRQRLTLRTRARKEGKVEISISDTGRGVAPEAIDRLFEPFSSTKPGGMGLGLSICRSIVEAHGGTIRWAPNQGGGSVFRFTLPQSTPSRVN